MWSGGFIGPDAAAWVAATAVVVLSERVRIESLLELGYACVRARTTITGHKEASMSDWQIGVFGALLGIIAYQTYGLADEARKINKRLSEIATLLRRSPEDDPEF
ncbi:hypothetical protein WK00_08935 [Burkholderia ubonensis]|nr:hypothetical protein WK00_08935 [Burkholderia ubonensis]